MDGLDGVWGVIGVSIGGVVVGLSLLVWQWFAWWPGKDAFLRDPLGSLGELAPFVLGWAYGALGTLTVMGLIGMAFDVALWASNWLGDAAGWALVGAPVGVTAAGAPVQLTALGTWMVVLYTVGAVAAIRFRKGISGHLKRGVWSGCCLGTSSTFAGLAAAPLAHATNWLGDHTIGAVT